MNKQKTGKKSTIPNRMNKEKIVLSGMNKHGKKVAVRMSTVDTLLG
jgi:hypothetical protein